MDLKGVKKLILKGKLIEEILSGFNWKEFEEFVSEILRNNDFKIKQNFRFKTKKKFEIDILAVRNNLVLVIDCKSWSSGRYKKSELRKAVKNQELRLEELKKFLKRNLIVRQMFKISLKSKFYPLIVSLLEEELIKESKTFIIPVFKLNSFLLEIEKYL